MRQFKPDWERAIPQHPSPKTISFFVASVLQQPVISPSAVGTLVTLFTNTIQAWNCTCFEYSRFHFSSHSAAQMNQPKVIFFTPFVLIHAVDIKPTLKAWSLMVNMQSAT